MKKLILFLSVLMLTVVGLQAQKTITYTLIDGETATNTDTLIGLYPTIIPADMWYSVQVVADSLTGGTAGTVYLQQSNAYSGGKWTTLTDKSLTVNGVLSEVIWEATTGFLGARLRVYVLNTGTNTTEYTVNLVLKRKSQ